MVRLATARSIVEARIVQGVYSGEDESVRVL